MNVSRRLGVSPRALKLLLEAGIVLAVLIGGYRLCLPHMVQSEARTLIDWELKPAVMLACGHGFTQPSDYSERVGDFFARKTASISCVDLIQGSPEAAEGIAYVSRYSIYGAAWAMRIGGLSWETLDRYLAILFGLSMSLIYCLYRIMVGRVLAVCGVTMLACSPILGDVLSLRDFVKLPAFATVWLVSAFLYQRGNAAGPKAILVPMILGGVALGIGIGLRMDVLVMVPALLALAWLGVPGLSRANLEAKAVATGAFVVAFGVAGGPILWSMSSGSNSAHVILLGLMRPFDRSLGIERAPYDIGVHYADGYVSTLIAAQASLHGADPQLVTLGSSAYDRAGGQVLSTLVRYFPGDAVTRGVAAILQIVRYPFDWRIRATAEQMRAFQSSEALSTILEWRTRILGLFEGRELQAIAWVLLLAAALDRRLAPTSVLLVFYICGYSMLQFSRRHTFHLIPEST